MFVSIIWVPRGLEDRGEYLWTLLSGYLNGPVTSDYMENDNLKARGSTRREQLGPDSRGRKVPGIGGLDTCPQARKGHLTKLLYPALDWATKSRR